MGAKDFAARRAQYQQCSLQALDSVCLETGAVHVDVSKSDSVRLLLYLGSPSRSVDKTLDPKPSSILHGLSACIHSEQWLGTALPLG